MAGSAPKRKIKKPPMVKPRPILILVLENL